MKLEPDFGIVGYTDRWSYRPGEHVALHLSAMHATAAIARLFRFRELVQQDAGLEVSVDLVPNVAVDLSIGPQQTVIGSWFEVGDEGRLGAEGPFTLALLAQPTLFAEPGNALCGQASQSAGFVLAVTGAGGLCFRCRAADGREARIDLAAGLVLGRWEGIAISFDPGSRVLALAAECEGQLRAATTTADFVFRDPSMPLRLAACPLSFAGPMAGFNGRIEAPAVWGAALTPSVAFDRLRVLAEGRLPPGDGLLAAWDFSKAIDSAIGCDIGPRGLDGRFVNLPTRAVKGSQWRGNEQSWRHAPRDYASVHFHQDDLADANWEVAARLALPDALASGCYLIEIAGEAGRDVLPIFVTAAKRGEAAKLALLMPTFTYLAYANDHCLLHGSNPEMFSGRLLTLTAVDCELAKHPEYGLSLYDTHVDGSGVSYASRHRPCLTLRHSQRAWQGGLGSGLWNFGADLLILSWLQRAGIAFEVITDDELDAEGRAALDGYHCVMTGSHPEYHSERMLDGIAGYLGGGGRLIYLGGNGFYWRVSTHPAYPQTIELRRAEDGNRSWASEPGEYYHAFDGAYGGLWRRNGRPPQALVGVGYTGQGFLRCHPYRLLPARHDPRVSFLFAGIPAQLETVGDFGLIGDGAAGIEIDRADATLGTPPHALVLATADRLDDNYVLANEEVLVNRPNVVGELSPLIRADLAFFETSSGGAVLSTGSIAWAGSLADARSPNPIARLTENAVRRFVDPLPFAPPHASGRAHPTPGAE